MYREHSIKAGSKYEEAFLIQNLSDSPIEILTIQKDYSIDRGKDIFLEPNTLPRSNASWLKIRYPRFLLKAKKQVNLKIPIVVPKGVSGSYHSLLIFRLRNPDEKEEGISLKISFQVAIQIVTTVSPDIKRDVKIVGVEVDNEKNLLCLDLENIGNKVLALRIRPDNKLIEQGVKIRIYPDMVNRKCLDIKALKDGLYEERIVLDDGKEFLKSFTIKFRKGEPPPPLAELRKIKAKRLARERRGKPYSLRGGIQFGKRRKGLTLSGGLRFGDFNFNFGSNYSQYFYHEHSTDFQSYRFSGNWRKGKFFLGMGNFWYGSMWTSGLRGGMGWRGGSVSLNYGLRYEVINLNVFQRLKLFGKNFNLRIYGLKSPYMIDYNISLSFKIL